MNMNIKFTTNTIDNCWFLYKPITYVHKQQVCKWISACLYENYCSLHLF